MSDKSVDAEAPKPSAHTKEEHVFNTVEHIDLWKHTHTQIEVCAECGEFLDKE